MQNLCRRSPRCPQLIPILLPALAPTPTHSHPRRPPYHVVLRFVAASARRITHFFAWGSCGSCFPRYPTQECEFFAKNRWRTSHPLRTKSPAKNLFKGAKATPKLRRRRGKKTPIQAQRPAGSHLGHRSATAPQRSTAGAAAARSSTYTGGRSCGLSSATGDCLLRTRFK